MSDLAVGQVIRLADGRNAVVRFVGETLFAPGVWVGCELDDGTGKNDGSVQNERYFECDMGHGMFVRPAAVTVVAQPPPKQRASTGAGAAAAAKKRPSSFAAGSRSASNTLDPGAGRRRSMNAPSPSPVPRTSRPSSIARVSRIHAAGGGEVAHVWLRPIADMLGTLGVVSYQISHEAARHRRFERRDLADGHTGQRTRRSSHQGASAFDEQHQGVHGPSCEARSSGLRVLHVRGQRRVSKVRGQSPFTGDEPSPPGDLETRLARLAIWGGKTCVDRQGWCHVAAERQ